ncbi:MAG TPA: FAD-binding protein [Trebonia sp.]|nr:FAD-binding protein [Trebonia sp.]
MSYISDMQDPSRPNRRDFLSGLAAGALISGFDPVGRSWVTGAWHAPAVRVPALKGKLVFDNAALSTDADDFGHIIHDRPWAVLQPGDINDIVVMLRFCNEQRIPAAPRGQGHATYGQAQASGGLVIETGTLDAIKVGAGSVEAGAGARWSSVLAATLPQGLTPPVLTDYLELSVGGTLSVGGVGGASPHYGAQVDNVLELEVVTGAGRRVVCSPGDEPELFYAVLAGLGQCAVLVRATLRLVPAPGNVRHYILYYPSVDALTADQRLVQADGRFSFAEGEAALNPNGPGWQYYIEAAAFYDSTPPDDVTLIGDLHFERGTQQIEDLGYFDFLDRLAPDVAFLESTGEWYDPHPWWNVFLPDSVTDAFVSGLMAGLTEADIGASGVILLYPLTRATLRAPLLRVPGEPVVFLLSLLRTAAPDSGGALAADVMLTDNRALFEQARDLGGYQYPIGSIPMTRRDWREHFGGQWPFLATMRQRYDPAGILTPGQGIFDPGPFR